MLPLALPLLANVCLLYYLSTIFYMVPPSTGFKPLNLGSLANGAANVLQMLVNVCQPSLVLQKVSSNAIGTWI